MWHWICHCYWTDCRNVHIGKCSSVNLTILESRPAQIVQKCRNHIDIVGVRRVTQSKSHTKYLQLSGTTIQNLVTIVTWHPGFVHPGYVLIKYLLQSPHLCSVDIILLYWHLNCLPVYCPVSLIFTLLLSSPAPTKSKRRVSFYCCKIVFISFLLLSVAFLFSFFPVFFFFLFF